MIIRIKQFAVLAVGNAQQILAIIIIIVIIECSKHFYVLFHLVFTGNL